MLKNLHSELKKLLYLLFRKSLDEGTVPNDWKMANVSPIHKKGNKKLTSNFRPVSLTSVVGKLLERLINQAIMTHLSQHNLINDTQHGFLPKRSCQTNLLLYLELQTSCIDKGLGIDVLYLDFAKAFDKVPHKRLLKKSKPMEFLVKCTAGLRTGLWTENNGLNSTAHTLDGTRLPVEYHKALFWDLLCF